MTSLSETGQQVPNSEDLVRSTDVRGMFGDIAPRYDLANSFLSLGIHKLWRRRLRAKWRSVLPGPVLDVCTGTGSVFLPEAKRRWFALGLLSLLPLLVIPGTKHNSILPVIVSLLSYSAFGVTRFFSFDNSLSDRAVILAIAFSFAYASLLAQIPLLRLLENKGNPPENKWVLRALSMCWAGLPAVCVSVIGLGFLPNAYLSTLIALLFIQRLVDMLRAREKGAELSPFYYRTSLVTIWLQMLALLCSAVLSSSIAHGTLFL